MTPLLQLSTTCTLDRTLWYKLDVAPEPHLDLTSARTMAPDRAYHTQKEYSTYFNNHATCTLRKLVSLEREGAPLAEANQKSGARWLVFDSGLFWKKSQSYLVNPP